MVLFNIFELEGIYKRLEAGSHGFRRVRVDDENRTHVGVSCNVVIHRLLLERCSP
jgi:hypothetical protein